ncbi:DUF3822 family protein [Tenacibaculum retecalamus]|uniref:DUF3822 family protein n=1 Tax=Tenacibaculum retecalamus TaxID=3018315 RepID=UPI0023D918B1|nr:DUF3822 family protein [Tenacibaculum retecalamus]WBX72397.1 DUF3822 family protein [Tenacibaculum retecalamus]
MKRLLKKTKKSSAIAQNKNLSIQFSLDGFSFCIANSDTKEILLFTEYTFKNPLASPEVLLDKIITIFATDKDLQQDFITVFAIHQNNLATLVPNEYFDRSNLEAYLKYTVKTLSTDFITYDSLEAIAANTVYIPYVNINNYLFQNFGEFEYKHHSTILIDKLLNFSKEDSEKQFFVQVSYNQIDIVVCQKNNLILYNSFSFSTKEDFIYYILFVAEQLQMDPNEFQLTLIGAIEKTSELYDIAYNYVRNIHFFKPISNFFTESEEFSNHSNFILAN